MGPRAGNRSVLAATAAALALVVVGAPAPVQAAATRPNAGALSPRLAELAKPAVRSAPPASQARALSLAADGPGSLLRDGNRVLVEVRFDHGAAASAPELRAAGAEVLNVSNRYQTVTVAAKPGELRALPGVPGALGAKEVLTPVTAATEPCPSGLTVSEGDQQVRAKEARDKFSVDGSGVTVGILSDSFDLDSSAETDAAEDAETADLPGDGNPCGQTEPTDVIDEFAPGSEDPDPADEGRAMAQIVHDLAPGASLAFASAFNGEQAFAQNIENLAKPVADGGAEAGVIADDVFYYDEPFFQDGPVAVAASKVSEEGVSYFSAAGNDNIPDAEGNEIASWEAPAFRDSSGCPAGTPTYAAHCMDFNPGAGTDSGFGITVEPGGTLNVDLQWAQPWYGVHTDFDAYLLKGGVRIRESEYPNLHPGIQEPFEFLSWTNPSKSEPATVELAIDRCDTSCGAARAKAHPTTHAGTVGGDSDLPRLKFALLGNGGGAEATEYPVSHGGDTVGPTVFGHSGAEDVVSVAAVAAPIFEEDEAEFYSSRGPASHYFGPVLDTSPAAELGTAEILSKPDLAATDCGVTTFFGFRFEETGGELTRRFCGTSAAAPHAAAVVALMRNQQPTATPSALRTALTGSAAPLGSAEPCSVGAGLVDAVAAIELLESDEPGAPASSCEPPEQQTWTVLDEEVIAGAPIPIAPVEETPTDFVVQKIPGARSTARPRSPSTYFRKSPRPLIRTRRRSGRAIFRFGSNQGAVTFLCKVDRGRFHRCPARFARRYRLGRHVLRVKARGAGGQVDRTPAVFRFRVKRVGRGT